MDASNDDRTDTKPEPENTCYQMAYAVLPQYAENDADGLAERLTKGPVGAAFFYILTCKWLERDPDATDVAAARALEVRAGSLDERHDYLAIRYPEPRPVDLASLSVEQFVATSPHVVLAPHFSVLVRPADGGAPQYFVLGQSSVDGRTTLRKVSSTFNANLGPGPEPEWEPLLDHLRSGLAAGGFTPVAGVGRPRPGEWPGHPAPDPPAKKWWQFWKH